MNGKKHGIIRVELLDFGSCLKPDSGYIVDSFPYICGHNSIFTLKDMSEFESHLRIKKSTLPHAGKGLFTRLFIPKGSRIVEYTGTITTWKEVAHHEGKNGYIFYVKRNHVIDAAPHPKALARYANDAMGLSRVRGVSNNAAYFEEGNKVYIVAKKNIPAGAEILVGYGKEYWASVRHNNRIDQQG
jgi:SET domain-containing protein